VITGGDAALLQRHEQLSLDWLETPHACGWLALPREATPHNHGTGCTFASAMASALALGWVTADAAVLAKMAATHALRHARAVGRGVGPVIAREGFVTDPTLLPRLSLDEELPHALAQRPRGRAPGVYAIVDSAERVEAVLSVRPTVDTIQLRLKRPTDMDDTTWETTLRQAVTRSQRAADAAGVLLVVNDHWRIAIDAGARSLHLGQEDLLALSAQDRTKLQAAREGGVQLGVSSHSLWELCRASALAPDYIACGPIWPTTTKDMPWHPQGLDNLAWWAHMARAVVGIGGILEPAQLQAVAETGATGGCVVRGLGDDPGLTLPAWRAAWEQGKRRHPDDRAVTHGPHPSSAWSFRVDLDRGHGPMAPGLRRGADRHAKLPGVQVCGCRLQVFRPAAGQRPGDVHLTHDSVAVQHGHALSVLADEETGVTCSKFAVANHRGSGGGADGIHLSDAEAL